MRLLIYIFFLLGLLWLSSPSRGRGHSPAVPPCVLDATVTYIGEPRGESEDAVAIVETDERLYPLECSVTRNGALLYVGDRVSIQVTAPARWRPGTDHDQGAWMVEPFVVEVLDIIETARSVRSKSRSILLR